MKNIGGLYLKKDKNGKPFLAGRIRDEKILVFKNTKKKTEKHPDYVVMVADEKSADIPF